MNRSERRAALLILPLIAALCVVLVSIGPVRIVGTITSESGIWDLTGADFSQGVYIIQGDVEYVSGRLLTRRSLTNRRISRSAGLLPITFVKEVCQKNHNPAKNSSNHLLH